MCKFWWASYKDTGHNRLTVNVAYFRKPINIVHLNKPRILEKKPQRS